MTPSVRTRCLTAVALAALLVAAPPLARAQGYTIPWSSLSAGAVSPSTGGPFALRGTAGQPGPGLLSGGTFALQGGFWVAPAAPTTSAGPGDAALEPDRLSAPRPNPFQRSTEVAFTLSHDGAARLEVYDLAGQRVRSLFDGRQSAGGYRVHWDGTGENGRVLAAGVYFFRLETAARRTTRRVVLLR